VFFPLIAVDDDIIDVGLTTLKICNDFVNKTQIFHAKRYNPSGVTKAEISLAWSVNGTYQNALRRSDFVTYLAFPTL